MLAVVDQGGKPLADVSVQAFGKTAQCIERALACLPTATPEPCATIAALSTLETVDD
jgi:hypothetical protein